MKYLYIALFFANTLAAQTVCENRAPLNQSDVFRWIMSVTKDDKEFVSDRYFYGKKAGTLIDREMNWSLVGFYTDEQYDVLNRALRADVKNKPVAYLADAINQALCDFPVHEGYVYRGATLPESAIKEYKEILDTEIAKTIVLKAFTSTSKKQKVGCDFAGNVIYKIFSRHGRVIEEASLKKFEKEVLFHKATLFTVLDVSTDKDVVREETECKKKGLTLVKLEEVP